MESSFQAAQRLEQEKQIAAIVERDRQRSRETVASQNLNPKTAAMRSAGIAQIQEQHQHRSTKQGE
jgi:hypothetical protein